MRTNGQKILYLLLNLKKDFITDFNVSNMFLTNSFLNFTCELQDRIVNFEIERNEDNQFFYKITYYIISLNEKDAISYFKNNPKLCIPEVYENDLINEMLNILNTKDLTLLEEGESTV